MKKKKEKYSGLSFVANVFVALAFIMLIGCGMMFLYIFTDSDPTETNDIITGISLLLGSGLFFITGEVSKLLIEIKNNTSKPTIKETEIKDSDQ